MHKTEISTQTLPHTKVCDSHLCSLFYFTGCFTSFYPGEMECSATELTRPRVQDVGKQFLDVSFSHTRVCKITASIDMEI